MNPADTIGVTGVILVGGRSRRMGRDKALLTVGGRTLFEITLEAVREVVETVILVGDRPERFASWGLPVYPDLIEGSALGGVYTGLVRAETSPIFVASCDLPFPSTEIIQRLVDLAPGYDVVVPETPKGYEPLFAVYSQGCREPILKQLRGGNRCVFDFYPQVRTRAVTFGELAGIADLERCFLNLNTPEEYRRITGEELSP